MFFFVDESGNTGNALFNESQPVLSYGVLASKTNVDVLALREHAALLRKIGSPSIHAADLGAEGLARIATDLLALHRKFDLRFDYSYIEKKCFATVMLFNAVFDAGLNEAVPEDTYWTPMKFPLLLALGEVVDVDILRDSWELCSMSKARLEKAGEKMVALLTRILMKAEGAHMDARVKEIIRDALRYGALNPTKLDFGTYDSKMSSPNAVGFQFVISSISRALKAPAATQLPPPAST